MLGKVNVAFAQREIRCGPKSIVSRSISGLGLAAGSWACYRAAVMVGDVSRRTGQAGRSKPRARPKTMGHRRERLSPARNLRAWIGAWQFEPREYEKIQKLLSELRHAE